jgi:hypothetical protein
LRKRLAGRNCGGGSHVDGKKILERTAQETGGRLFEAAKKQTVVQIYDQIVEELRGHYRLGYTPIMSRLLPDRPDYP